MVYLSLTRDIALKFIFFPSFGLFLFVSRKFNKKRENVNLYQKCLAHLSFSELYFSQNCRTYDVGLYFNFIT